MCSCSTCVSDDTEAIPDTPTPAPCPAEPNVKFDRDSCTLVCEKDLTAECAKEGKSYNAKTCRCQSPAGAKAASQSVLSASSGDEQTQLNPQSRQFSYTAAVEQITAAEFYEDYYQEAIAGMAEIPGAMWPSALRNAYPPVDAFGEQLPPGAVIKPCGLTQHLINGACAEVKDEKCADGRLANSGGDCSSACPNPLNPKKPGRKSCACVSKKCCKAPQQWNPTTNTCTCPQLAPKRGGPPRCSKSAVPSELNKKTCWCEGTLDNQAFSAEAPTCAKGILDFETCSCIVIPQEPAIRPNGKTFNEFTCKFD